ncbi:MAG: site-specific DNA-methyltransferase [Clostridiaceae bacterium]|nr:site-specific DNA-methyltransferase [Clostridiaceae bacterium]
MIETNLKGNTPDIAEENIQKLKQIFPDVFTEDKVDFEKLQQVLGDYVEDNNERYNFTWNGKGRALRLSQTPSLGTLRPCKEESKDWDTTQNLYIEGDNLEVLKLLQKSYYGKVKMIYIDPPYNTGKDFVYKDDFHDSLENYKRITGQVDGNGKPISTNTEASGRYHTDWLNMMYPRLRLARNLLSDDGVIFISIDDNEVHNLRKICDEIFNENNLIAEFAVASNSSKNNSKYVSVSHEYILCYAKQKESLNNEWKVKKNNVDEYYSRAMQLVKKGISQEEIHEELLALVKYPRFYDLDHYTYADEKGIYQTDNPGGVTNGNNESEIVHPITGKNCTKPNGGWRYKDAEIERLVSEGLFAFGKDETIIPRVKRYLDDYIYQVPKSILFFDSQSSTKWLKNNNIPFDFAKAVELMKYIISISSKDSIILDFYSGSATTAHAVMELNAEDGGNRKFICVQLPEICDESSQAYKVGYKNICEIGKERIRRAGEKIKEEKGLEAQNLDIGFKVLKLDTSNIRKWQPDYDNLEQSILDYVDNYVDGRTELDVVYEIMLKYGLDLTYPVDEFTLAQKKVYSIGFGMLMICLDNEITTEVAKGILEKVKELAPESTRVVFKDNGFKTDSNKTNIKEILKCGGIEEFITL